MRFRARFSSLLRSLFRKRALDRELDEELRSYLETLTEEKIAAGLSRPAARRAALLEMEGVEQVKEKVREVRMGALLQDLGQDTRYGLRMLRKNPGFTAVAVLTLALGIGANTAVFSVVNAALLRPLPYRDSDRVVYVLGWDTQRDTMRFNINSWDLLDLQQRNQAFEEMGAHRWWSVNITGDSRPERVLGYHVTPNIFPLLGVKPFLGRNFRPDESRPGSELVVILSHGLWTRRFGTDPGIIGQSVILDGESYVIMGVMPAGFDYPQFNFRGDLWSPLRVDPTAQRSITNPGSSLVAVARLKAGVSIAQAQAEMDVLTAQLSEEYPRIHANWGVRVIRLQELMTSRVRAALLISAIAVAMVLLIACANVANLLLMRGLHRQGELGVRRALGAGRLRLIRQLLTENLVLFLLGAMGGLLLAHWGLTALRAAAPDYLIGSLPSLLEFGLDVRTLTLALVLSAAAGLIFGLIPALRASRQDPQTILREGSRLTLGRGRQRLSRALVVGEVALSLVLLVSTGLLIGSFLKLLEVSPGFNPRNVLALSISLPEYRYAETEGQRAFFQQVLERVSSVPGVEAAGMVNTLPFSTSNSSTSFLPEGVAPAHPGEMPRTDFRVITPDYFRTLQIPLRRGRAFTGQDHEDQPPVVIINEALARSYFPGEDPLGKRIQLRRRGPDAPWREIVGVVGNVRHWELTMEVRPESYVPLSQFARTNMTLAVRTAGPPGGAANAIRAEIQAVDPSQPVYNVKPLEDWILQSLLPQRFAMYLMMVFAVVALAISAVGLYGVIAFAVANKTHEFGVRVALGAQPSAILRMVVRQGMTLTLIGVGLGLAGAFAVTRFLESLLFGVTPTDPATIAVVSLTLMAVALLACYVPARRAAKVDPMVALRYE